MDSSIWETKIKIGKPSKPVKPEKHKEKQSNAGSELTWQSKKIPNRKYKEPQDTVTINLEIEASSDRKHVVVVGGLYLGSAAACAETVLNEVDLETTHSLVILGNLFDTLSIDPFHQAPTDITNIESVLAQSKPVLEIIQKLAEEINVYYMRGSFDGELSRSAIDRLLGTKIIYIQQTNLILSLQAGVESYRVLLTSGKQWDFLNQTDKLTNDQLVFGKPIGHYLARAAMSNPSFSPSTLMKPVVSNLPAEMSKHFLKQISKRPLQDKLTTRMLLAAFQMNQPEELIDIQCLVDEGKYISVQSVVEYPYIKYLMEKVIAFDP